MLFVVFATLCNSVLAASSVTSLSLYSSQLREQRQADVYLPDGYQTSASRYPVLYLLDGQANGAMAFSLLERMFLSGGANEHIVVAIYSTDRLRDYAPTVNRDPRGPVGQGGGGDAFLNFMQQELMPKIDAAYRTSGFNSISGHSVGGLLVMHSFHSRPELFQAHFAFSPAVWWGERETLKATEAYILSDEDIGSYLYMNIGEESGQMRAVYDGLVDTIRKNRNADLVYRAEQYNTEAHGLTMAAGLYSAFKGLYEYQQNGASK